jgi:hypothetical protein
MKVSLKAVIFESNARSCVYLLGQVQTYLSAFLWKLCPKVAQGNLRLSKSSPRKLEVVQK